MNKEIHRITEVNMSNEAETNVTVIADTTGNPAPLGLMGFGLTTVLLNMHNMGMFGMSSMILAMGIFYGGLGQLFVGMMEWKKKNTFGTVAFTSYGCFWLTLVGLIALPKMGFDAPDPKSMAAYLGMWGLFSLVLFIGTLKLNRGLQVVFFLLVVLFFLLAIGETGGSAGLKKFTGFEGILCGLSAMYVAAAEILNEVYKRKVLPI